MRMFYDKDVSMDALKGKKVAILGYGSQGHAHAQNLRDSGVDVVVGLHDGSKSAARAKEDGFEVLSVADATKAGDVVMCLLPDEVQRIVYAESIKDNLKEGKTLAFAHGFNIHFGYITPPEYVDVIMVAPKGPGHLVRSVYKEGSGVPDLFAVYQNYTGKAEETVLAYAKGIGGTRAGVLETTFKEETETDLFGEQAVLCGGCEELIKAGFETLVDAGYQPEIAYFECLHETAEYGGYVSGKRVIGEASKAAMKEVLADIQSGKFAKDFIAESESGCKKFHAMREEQYSSQISETGRQLRSMMTFLKK